MTLQQLQYVVALDTHRHFVRAAESCFVAQPTLTLQVKKLEEEISLTIFDRSVQPIEPTAMGEKFIMKARQILRQIDELKAMVNDDRDQLEGTYKVGIIPTLAPYLLPLFLKTFTDANPQVVLDIREVQSESIIAGLLNNTLDIGIMVTPLQEGHIREIPLFYEPFLIYANKDNPILKQQQLEAGDLHTSGLWLLENGHCFRNQVLNVCKKGKQLQADEHIRFESGSIETLRNMVQYLSGYTLMPELAVNPDTDTPFTRRFDGQQPVREVSLVTHTSFTKEMLLTNLRKNIIKAVPDTFQKNSRFITVKWR